MRELMGYVDASKSKFTSTTQVKEVKDWMSSAWDSVFESHIALNLSPSYWTTTEVEILNYGLSLIELWTGFSTWIWNWRMYSGRKDYTGQLLHFPWNLFSEVLATSDELETKNTDWL